MSFQVLKPRRARFLAAAVLTLAALPSRALSSKAYTYGGGANGSLTLETRDVDGTRAKITELAKGAGAELQSLSASTNAQNGKKMFSVSLLVDKSKVMGLMETISKMGTVTHQNYYDNAQQQQPAPEQLRTLDRDIDVLGGALNRAPAVSALVQQQRQNLLQQVKQGQSSQALLSLSVQQSGYNNAGWGRMACGMSAANRSDCGPWTFLAVLVLLGLGGWYVCRTRCKRPGAALSAPVPPPK